MAMYPKELLDLLQEYLTDGFIDPVERQVLCNKAQSLGIDPVEFDLYIKSQEQKIEFAKQDALNKQKGRLCPFCQQPLQMLTDTCPHCGQTVTPEASKDVEELINTLEAALVSFQGMAEKKKDNYRAKSSVNPMQQLEGMVNIFTGKGAKPDTSNIDYATQKAEVERYIRKAKMYYSNNKTLNFLVAEVEKVVETTEKSIKSTKNRKRNIILGIVIGYIVLMIIFAIIGSLL